MTDKLTHYDGLRGILSLIDNVLLSAGWESDDTGWIPPVEWREVIASRHGSGMHWSRETAIRFTVRVYERVLKVL